MYVFASLLCKTIFVWFCISLIFKMLNTFHKFVIFYYAELSFYAFCILMVAFISINYLNIKNINFCP